MAHTPPQALPLTPALLAHLAALLPELVRPKQPAEAALAAYVKSQPKLGARDRALLGAAAYHVLRLRRGYEALVPAGSDWATRVAHAVQQGVDARAAHPHHLPDWLATALQAAHPQFDALAAALLEPAPLDLRVNLHRAKPAAVQAALAEAGLTAQPTPLAPAGLRLTQRVNVQRLPAFAQGWFEVQDEGSQLLALLVGARRGEQVVDFCAGAGGKTLALTDAMRGQGQLLALDTSAHRLAAMAPRLARAGVQGMVQTMALEGLADARLQRWQRKAHRVLVDAPCSGLGTLRRYPGIKWRLQPSDITAHATVQAQLLQAAARLVAPGGRLVYATCSLLPNENQAIAQAFSAQHPAWQPLPVAQALPKSVAERLPNMGPYLSLRPDQHGCDGFFAAVWQAPA
jgi:16S rRNA (cytosine967-C5)-methyltransferase